MGQNARPFRKRARLFAVRNLGRPLVWALKRTRWENADRLSRVLGWIAYTLSRRYRTVAVDNLRAAFPELTEDEAKRLTKRTFCNFCRALVEFFIAERFDQSDVRRVTELIGIENLDDALRGGKGAIVITAHIGNWEILARRAAAEGYPVNVIARDSDDPTMTGIVNRVRESAGYKVLSRDSSVRSALRCLRANESLGILPDQNTLGDCVFVDFFGRPVATAAGPALFALRTGAPVLCAFSSWERETKRYICVVYPPIEAALTGEADRDVEIVTAAYTKAIEAEIRKRPADWLWLHSRWKRANEAPGASAESKQAAAAAPR